MVRRCVRNNDIVCCKTRGLDSVRHLVLEDSKLALVVIELGLEPLIRFLSLVKFLFLGLRSDFEVLLTLLKILFELLVLVAELADGDLGILVLLKQLLFGRFHLHLQVLLEGVLVGLHLLLLKSQSFDIGLDLSGLALKLRLACLHFFRKLIGRCPARFEL